MTNVDCSIKASSICLLSCYFGQWPSFMPLFLESCRRNPTIDFLFFGDGGPVPHVPANVTIVPLTFDEMLNRLNERLNLTVDVKDPYKLCDFKPAYGHVFEEYLQGYDFWGYTDFDLVYGSIRSFFTDELLKRSDVVSCRPAWITGGCFLFRNTERLNTLFRLSNDHVRAFTSEERLTFSNTVMRESNWRKVFPFSMLIRRVKV